ncbi:uncharacterized protein BDZ99DRAFT_574599 [Mytilinidion resinicola]|uniref:C2H2-type domain-containing protein n=1 Tax=Mytilinidion resinicola TaxID=574789 RepID=A0A6A6YA85_9PEZI|nr:uncharacterized protein BDZ99DRAFT_574599 [Mytilinidion resinicola]KAF2805726.1 hypothetical protein BDZ99DRAFT_574599 [Mytilinidion resinicola]
MADLSRLSDREIVEALLDRYGVGELGRLILNIDQSRRSSVHSSRPDSPISTVSLTSNSSQSGRYAASSASSVPPLRRSCDTNNSAISFASQYLHAPHLQHPSPLGPDPTLYEPITQPGAYQAYGVTSALPGSSPLNQIQSPLDCPTVNISQPKEMIEQPKRQLFCTFCAEQNVQKSVTFKTKSDWKKHETNFHETGHEWRCNVHGCFRIFERASDFLKHQQREHRHIPDSTDDAIVKLPDRVAFGCGFKGCKYVSYDWDDRCNHVAKCPLFFAGADWDYSTRIRNLLRQNCIHDEWKRFLISICYAWNIDRTKLRWNPKTSRVLRQKLECNDFADVPLLNFFINAVELGLGQSPVPDSFTTPRAQVTPDQKPSDVQQPHAQYIPIGPQGSDKLVPDKHPHEDMEALLGENHELPATFYLPDDTFDHEQTAYSTLSDIDSQRRASVTMLDVLDEPGLDLWPATEPIENVGLPACGSQSQELPNSELQIVNPGQPSHPVVETYHQYTDSVGPSRSTPVQRFNFKKSVKRVKSNLSSKKSQQFHQGITYNHPDLPLGAHSPNTSSVSSRSAGGSRVDLGRNVNMQS